MIVDEKNKGESLNKKLLPQSYEVVVSILSFIISDDELGIVLYKNEDEFSPYNYIVKLDITNKKIKIKKYADLIDKTYTLFKNNREYIKKAKENFEKNFNTKIELEDRQELYELTLDKNNNAVLKKHIICIMKSCEEIERTMNKEFVPNCVVVPLNNISQFIDKNNLSKYFVYFLNNFSV